VYRDDKSTQTKEDKCSDLAGIMLIIKLLSSIATSLKAQIVYQ
jgi:hypothetical protein